MDELIKSINKTTGFRIEIIYYSGATSEGYKAKFYGDTKEDYKMKEVFENPIDAIFRLAEEYGLSFR